MNMTNAAAGLGWLLDGLPATVLDGWCEEARPAVVAPVPEALHPTLGAHLRRCYPGGLWSHQAEAIARFVSGEHVAIVTPTASGKTLAFAAAAAHLLLTQPGARVLLFYPTKALASDQHGRMVEMFERLGLVGVVARLDGDVTGQERKDAIRRGRVLLCTPDILHVTMLRDHRGTYASVFDNLRLVVLDEAHTYTGAFGGNMAYLMRRLRQVARQHGSDVQFMAASATSGNPHSHLRSLTGLDWSVVGPERNGSPSAGRAHIVLQPEDTLGAESPGMGLGVAIAARLAARGERFLMFCQTRQGTEEALVSLLEASPGLSGKVMPYRAGYEPEDRQRIEGELRSKELCGITCTSAMELGVDLPAMRACIMVGLPSTIMSLRQRAGRVGREADNPGLVLMIPGTSALDEYYRRHPRDLQSRPLEELVVHLDNRQLIVAHFACARAESEDTMHPRLDPDIFGSSFAQFSARWQDYDDPILSSPEPHSQVNLRCVDDKTFEITGPTGNRMGTIMYSQILREAYTQAIYRHMGHAYRVQSVSHRNAEVRVDSAPSHCRTRPQGRLMVRPRDSATRRRTTWSDGLELVHGSLRVVMLTTGYRERIGGTWVGHKYPRAMERSFTTEGVWLKIPGRYGAKAVAVNSLVHALANSYGLITPCDSMDIATHFLAGKEDTFSYCMLFDNQSGGLGITEKAYDHIIELLDMAEERLGPCPNCDDGDDRGCPSCIQSTRWYEDNVNLDKPLGLLLAQKVRASMKVEPASSYDSPAHVERNRGALSTIVGPGSDTDGGEAGAGRRFIPVGCPVRLADGQLADVTGFEALAGAMRYSVRLEAGPVTKRADLGSNLTPLADLQQWCTQCAETGIGADEELCPSCGAVM